MTIGNVLTASIDNYETVGIVYADKQDENDLVVIKTNENGSYKRLFKFWNSEVIFFRAFENNVVFGINE